MKIDIRIELDTYDDADRSVAERLLQAFGGELQAPERREWKSAAVAFEAGPEHPQQAPAEAEATQGEEGAGNEADAQVALAELVARLDRKYKRTESGTAAGGAQVKVDDEVVNASGEVAVIVALYRGRAVVAYEDGTGEEVETKTLSLHASAGPATAATPMQQVAQQIEEAHDRRQGQKSAFDETLQGIRQGQRSALDEAAERIERPSEHGARSDALYEMAEKLSSKLGGRVVMNVLKDVAGVDKFKNIPEGQYDAVYDAFVDRLATD